ADVHSVSDGSARSPPGLPAVGPARSVDPRSAAGAGSLPVDGIVGSPPPAVGSPPPPTGGAAPPRQPALQSTPQSKRAKRIAVQVSKEHAGRNPRAARETTTAGIGSTHRSRQPLVDSIRTWG